MSKDDLGQTEPPLPGRDRSHNVTERELKPCPFCGGRAAIQQGGFTKYVMCLKCEVMGPNLASDVELIDAWNRRTTPDREAIEPTPMKEPDKFGWQEPAWRMDAYYYGFAPTGVAIIDRILSAVACAGKSFHHTQDWTDHCSPYEHLQGETVVDWIQNAANDAAGFLKTAPNGEKGDS